jgi:1-acyl-sn-glycerol-3-phosphate acyltransferase
MFRDVFARCWAFWGLVSFIVSFMTIFPIAMCSHFIRNPYESQAFFIRVSYYWIRCWLWLIGCRLSVKGTHHFTDSKPFIIAFNHRSTMDIPLSCPFVPGANRTIAKDSFAKIPLFGLFYKKGAVLVNRKSDRSRRQSYEKMKGVLADGIHMCIYPEGTRNRTSALLKPFYDGAFRLAKDTNTPIIPALLCGTSDAMPMNKPFYLLPTNLTIEFLEPIAPDTMDVKTLNEKVHAVMLAALQQKK